MSSQLGQPSLVPKHLQDDEDLSQECRDMISTLPKEQGWIANHVYQYQGFWYNLRQIQGLLSCQKHFQSHDINNDIIILATIPKSGTTWLKALTFSLLNRNTYPNTHENHPLLTTNPHVLVPFLELNLFGNFDDDKVEINPNNLIESSLFATHLAYISLPKSLKESSCKIVYLCRDPKDTFISLWQFTNKLRPETQVKKSVDEYFEQFCKGVSPCGPFWEHVLGYWKESLERPKKIMFLRYEEMKLHPTLILKELAEFIGCPFSKEELDEGMLEDILKLCSFDNLSNLEVNKTGISPLFHIENKSYFRRGQIGDGEKFLSSEMIGRLNKITENKLVKHGLRF
ncbi:cytosolic sulfotransferase 12-like [Arachis stenosperma]|uniref:cytosolic sulfotransferase 12-like n=1 Tax=Arachis stenosperma TaxID=217475 RepID=UPI0025ABE931|nr:cytosolic sulfotransferase 12-like [Arachis stenosperma]